MADIAINPVTRRVQFTGNTGTGPFAFTFNILADEDIQVYKNTTLLTLTTDYTVTTNANGTGSITLVAGQALISSDYLTIVGGRDLERTTDFVTGGDLLASSLNEQLDSNVIMSQQLDERFGRSISVSPGDVDVSLELPTASTRANQVLTFTSTGAVTTSELTSLPELTLDKLNVDNITLDGNTISTTDTNGNLTLAPNGTGDVIVSGDLIVNGATTTISSTELDITDKNITIASGSADSSAADGAGLTVDGPDATFNYMHDLLGWQLNKPITIGNTTTDYGGALNIYGKTFSGHVQTASVVLYSDSTSLDPFIKFHAQSSNVFSMGIDFSDNAMFKIANSSAIGSSPVFTITDDGEISLGTNQPQSGYRFTISGASGAQADIAFKQTGTDNAIINSFTDQMRFVGDLNNESSNTFSFKWFDGVTEKMILEGGTLKVDTINELTSAAGVTVDGVLLKDGGATVTADVSFGDSDKAIFGAGSDLQIYHDETTNHSYIIESGTGDLRVLASTFNVRNVANTENMLVATPNGSVDLYYDNSKKLATTSTGVDITGTLTSDGLTVDGDASLSGTSPHLTFYETDLADTNTRILTQTRKFRIGTVTDAGGSFTERFQIDHNTGDISFYEDTGTTAKFFWDASAESLGIGTSSPSASYGSDTVLEVSGSTSPGIVINDTGQASKYGIHADSNDLKITYGSGALVSFQNDGNVGIGTSSPKTELNVAANNSGQGPILTLENTDTSITTNDVLGQIDFYGNDGSTGGTGQKATIKAIAQNSSGTSVGLVFGTSPFPDTSATERMRIDSSGNVQIGTTTVNSTNTDVLTVGKSSSSYDANIVIRQFNNGTASNLFLYANNDTGAAYNRVSSATMGGTEHWKIGGVGGSAGSLPFSTSGSERMRIDSSGNVGIGISSPTAGLHIDNPQNGAITAILDTDNTAVKLVFRNNTETGNNVQIGADGSSLVALTNALERMRIDSSGNLLVGKTSSGVANTGFEVQPSGQTIITQTSADVLRLNRKTSDGTIIDLRKDGTTVGSIGNNGTNVYFAQSSKGVAVSSARIYPSTNSGAVADNSMDLGNSDARWDDIHATNGTIQTSDRNEKQDIAELTDAEQRVAIAAKGLLRKFRWRDAVAEKGDEARTHFGIIAQDLQAAFAAEGLDAGDYAMFIHSTWTDEETGEEKSRMGVRYSELLAFIIAAI